MACCSVLSADVVIIYERDRCKLLHDAQDPLPSTCRRGSRKRKRCAASAWMSNDDGGGGGGARGPVTVAFR